jgi:hypothetical protein
MNIIILLIEENLNYHALAYAKATKVVHTFCEFLFVALSFSTSRTHLWGHRTNGSPYNCSTERHELNRQEDNSTDAQTITGGF